MNAMQFKPFDQADKALLYERIQRLAEKQRQPREILYFLASQLHQQKIEIPGFCTFNEAISTMGHLRPIHSNRYSLFPISQFDTTS